MKLRTALALFAGIGLVSGCTASSSDGNGDRVEPQIVEVTPQPTGEDQPTPAPEGTIVNQYELEVSWCFNRYEIYSEQLDETTAVTTEVDCRRPHDGEVYATYFHPGDGDDPFPGSGEMERWANIMCRDGFKDFVGTDFELSQLYIGTIRPTEETWTGEGLHREVICYVYAPSAQLSGPMGESGI